MSRMKEMIEMPRIIEMSKMTEMIGIPRMIEKMTSILKRAVRAIMSGWTVNKKNLKLLLACKLMMLSRSTKLGPRVERALSRILLMRNNLRM
jgi:hypothetical protein